MRNRPLPQMGAAVPAPNPYAAAGQLPVDPYAAAAAAYDPMAGVVDPNRKLMPGDQLLVKIETDREPAVAVGVSQTGDIIVDPIPQGIRVAGLTVSQASSQIKQLLDRDYYYNATVRLTLERAMAARLRTVTISGEINRVGPIPIPADRPLKLSQACLLASGFKQFANDRKVAVTRTSDGKTDRFVVDVKSILNEGKVDRDVVLQDGDQIFVPRNGIQF